MGKIRVLGDRLLDSLRSLGKPRSSQTLRRMLARSRDTLNSLFIMPVKEEDGEEESCGWCLWFRAHPPEPPEITVVRDPTSSSSIIITPVDASEIDHTVLEQQFHLFVDELDLSTRNKEAMMDLPPEKKWQIFTSRRSAESPSLVSLSAEYYVDRVNNLIPLEEASTKLYESLRTALRTQPHSFVHRFLQLSGLESLLALLSSPSASKSHPSIVTCIKALMNNSGGRAAVLSSPTAINVLAQSLAGDDVRSKVDVLEILGAVCLVPGGHRKVLDSITYLQSFAQERARFQTLLNDLDRSTGAYRLEMSLKTAILSFLNALLNYGPGEQSLEFRLHLRFELLMLGIEAVVDKLKSLENENINKHIQFFEMLRNQDESEFAKNWGETHIDTRSSDEMFGIIKMRLSHSYAYANLLSILNHLLLIPVNVGGPPPQHWSLIDRLIQQIVLQKSDSGSGDADHVVVPAINVGDLVGRLATEEERRTLEERVESLERSCVSVRSALTVKEQECEVRLTENDDLRVGLQRARERLEKEALKRMEEANLVEELKQQVRGLQHLQQQQQQSCSSSAVPPKSPPRRKDVNGSASAASSSAATTATAAAAPPPPPPPPPPTATNNTGAIPPLTHSTTAPQSVPPLPPPLLLAPPPPAAASVIRLKSVPPSSAPLKSFNWSKLPETKLGGTLWAELEDEARHYHTLNLKEVDRLFSAFQKSEFCNGHSSSSSAAVVENNSVQQQILSKKASTVSLIDARRAQNCTILLSKLKMADDEICASVLSMDVGDNLPSDMLEQLLKFVPTTEEVLLLEEQQQIVDDVQQQLARADSFLLKVSRILHYEERLRVLHYKKRFSYLIEDTSGRMRAVLEACRELARSKKLRKMLELVLALGNYMNRGPRGNANGFKLKSLTRLQDTKSRTATVAATATVTTTLLHYLAGEVEAKYPDLVDLEADLGSVRVAAKVSLGELEKEMGYLREGMELVNREVEFQRGVVAEAVVEGDRFLTAVREFLSGAAGMLSENEDLFKDVKEVFHRTVRLFGEEIGQVDEFFSIFDQFLVAFADARADNEAQRRRREEEEKREKEMTLRRTSKTLSHHGNNGDRNGGDATSCGNGKNGVGGAEFDDLISALRTGDVFSDDHILNNKFVPTKSRSRAASSKKSNKDVIGSSCSSRERIH